MGSVTALPTRMTVDDAWEKYVALRRQFEADPLNRELAQDTLRAWKAFSDLFEKMEAVK